MPQISVIVPVYKVEKYLDACVQSVLGQDFAGFELLLVDDGSPDNSGALCDAWALRDERIRVVHKQNGGLSSARNAGLNTMRGKYAFFLDSDDTIAPGTLRAYFNKAEEGDFEVVSGGYTIIFPNSRRPVCMQAFEVTDPAALEPYAEGYFFSLIALIHNAAKLLRASFLNRHALRFNEAVRFGEDNEFYGRVFRHARRIANLAGCYYEYYKRDEDTALTRAPRLDGMEHSQRMRQAILSLLQDLGFAEKVRQFEASSLYLGYKMYYDQLNHPNLNIPLGQHYRRVKELLRIEDARAQLLEMTSGPSEKMRAATARMAHFCVKHRLALLLTLFIRLKSGLLRRRVKV